MPKFEVDSEADLLDWLAAARPAVFQGQDLTRHSAEIQAKALDGCVFLGCRMDDALAAAAAKAGCFILPTPPGLPFNPFTHALYSPAVLYDHFDPRDPVHSYEKCFDSIVYRSYLQTEVDVDLMLMRRLHDASVEEALDDFLSTPTGNPQRPTVRHRTVAIMGGHDVSRNDITYLKIAELARDLATAGYLVATGGGPGLMEAANLGAWCAGFRKASVLHDAIAAMHDAPLYNHPLWLASAFSAWKQMGTPDDPSRSRSVGIPTWFYGHEPPNVFATDIAKYFENSMREEGLLGVALAGIVFGEGNAGTVQEIFQDACQNYYRTYARAKSPMILLGSAYWNPQDPVPHHAGDRRKPLYPLLEKLATEKAFSDYLLLTDDPGKVLAFIERRPPIA